MAKNKKYYVVWVGNKTGIFDSWDTCKAQIQGFPNAKYKSFPSFSEAEKAYANGYERYRRSQGPSPSSKKASSPPSQANILWDSLSVDAACSGNPGIMEYRGVHTQTKEEWFRMGPFQRGTNNLGEFLAIVHGLALLNQQGKPDFPIYTDSKTAMSWVKNKRVRTTVSRGTDNEKLFQLIDRALIWLKNNSYSNPIHKWNTPKWGEIPADFGRK